MTTTYDPVGNVTSVTEPMGSSNTPTTTVYIWDADREKIGEIGPAPTGDGHYRAQRISYDLDGRVTLDETGYTTSQGDTTLSSFVSLQQHAYVYDNVGRKIQESESGGGTTFTLTQYSYDALNRLICSAVRMNASAFGSLSFSAGSAQPSNAACGLGPQGGDGPDRITYRTYDAAGQLLQTVLGYGTSAQTADHTSTYTLDGKEATAADGNGNLTTFTYDGFDRLSQTTYPSPTSAGSSNPNDYESYGYDAASNMLTRRLRDGATISMGYDALNRMTSKTVPGANPTYITYDLLNRPTMYAFSQGGAMDAINYDALGRVVRETTNNYPLTYAYDLAGDRTQITYNLDGRYITYAYDTDGELTTVQAPTANDSPKLLATYAYDDLGRRTGVTRGNGTTTTYSYDAISRLSGLSHTMPSTYAQWNESYGLGYTASGQLNQVTSSNSAYTFTPTAKSLSATPNGLNQLISFGGAGLRYDGRGNLTFDGTNTYSYDTLNQLSTVNGSTTLGYDARNRLISVSAGGATPTQFIYAGDQLAMEFTVSGSTPTIVRRYVPGVGEDHPIAMYNSGAFDYQYELLEDHAGSIIGVNNGSGNEYKVNTYDDYGVQGPGNWGRYQYTGQVWLSEVGLYNYKARMYSPTLGRFLQTDPVGYKDGLNWYAYVHDDPVNQTDPSGENGWDDFWKNVGNALSSLGNALKGQPEDPNDGYGPQKPEPKTNRQEPKGDVAEVVVTGHRLPKPDDGTAPDNGTAQGPRFARGRLRQQVMDKRRQPDGTVTCAYCGKPATTVDHIKPYSKGGPTVRENLDPACVPCNSSKGAKELGTEWKPPEPSLFPE